MEHPKDRLFVGIDWGAYEHRVCVVNASGEVLGELGVANNGDGLAELVTWLTDLVGGQVDRAWVAIEPPRVCRRLNYVTDVGSGARLAAVVAGPVGRAGNGSAFSALSTGWPHAADC